MAKQGKSAGQPVTSPPAAPKAGKPSALLDTRVVYCRDNLEQRVGGSWQSTPDPFNFPIGHPPPGGNRGGTLGDG